jgi:hypothetical protein
VETGGPVLAGGPVVFLCCDPCASHLCVRPDCDHGELDEKTFANAADALDLLHEGCLCFVMPKSEAVPVADAPAEVSILFHNAGS